jgi:hypothetical protein
VPHLSDTSTLTPPTDQGTKSRTVIKGSLARYLIEGTLLITCIQAPRLAAQRVIHPFVAVVLCGGLATYFIRRWIAARQGKTF